MRRGSREADALAGWMLLWGYIDSVINALMVIKIDALTSL